MNRKTILILLVVVIICFVIFFLPATSRQGINGRIKLIRMPLGVKLAEFFCRDYHYRNIAKEVTAGADKQQEKILRLFNWTFNYLHRVPEGFPVVDDHVLNIVIRAYATDDQFADVFATLCNYAGSKAFYSWIRPAAGAGPKITLTFVNIDGNWRVFDPYNGVYFVDSSGNLSSLDNFGSGAVQIKKLASGDIHIPDYAVYFTNIPLGPKDGFSRSIIQSPMRRMAYAIKTLFSKK